MYILYLRLIESYTSENKKEAYKYCNVCGIKSSCIYVTSSRNCVPLEKLPEDSSVILQDIIYQANFKNDRHNASSACTVVTFLQIKGKYSCLNNSSFHRTIKDK